MPFKDFKSIFNYDKYKAGIKTDLEHVSGDRSKFLYFDKFKFENGKVAPLLLVGPVPKEILAEVKTRVKEREPAQGRVTVKTEAGEKGVTLTTTRGKVPPDQLEKAVRATGFKRPLELAVGKPEEHDEDEDEDEKDDATPRRAGFVTGQKPLGSSAGPQIGGQRTAARSNAPAGPQIGGSRAAARPVPPAGGVDAHAAIEHIHPETSAPAFTRDVRGEAETPASPARPGALDESSESELDDYEMYERAENDESDAGYFPLQNDSESKSESDEEEDDDEWDDLDSDSEDEDDEEGTIRPAGQKKPRRRGPALTKLTAKRIGDLKAMVVKKYPDPLANDPEMKQLLAERAARKAALVEALRTPDDAESIEAAAGRVTEADAQIEARQQAINARGVQVQPRAAVYEGEESKFGWRKDNVGLNGLSRPKEPKLVVPPRPRRDEGEQDDAFAARMKSWDEVVAAAQAKFNDLHAMWEGIVREWEERMVPFDDWDRRVTKMYNDAERAASELKIALDGSLTDASGRVVKGHKEFVADPETGKMHWFKQEPTITGTTTHPITGQMVAKDVLKHHSSVLAGKPVLSAGAVDIDGDGRIAAIYNASGHYKPGMVQMIQVLELLARQGALLDQDWTDTNDEPPEGKAAELIHATLKQQAKLEASLAENANELKDLEREYAQTAARDEKGADHALLDKLDARDAKLAAAAKLIHVELETIAKAKQVLMKLGYAPRNEILPTRVAFIDGAADKTGAEVVLSADDALESAMGAKKFLKTGGGSLDQRDAKKDMQEELKATLARKAAMLDREAEVRATADVERLQRGVDHQRETALKRLGDPKKRAELIEKMQAEHRARGEDLSAEAAAAILDEHRAKLIAKMHAEKNARPIDASPETVEAALDEQIAKIDELKQRRKGRASVSSPGDADNAGSEIDPAHAYGSSSDEEGTEADEDGRAHVYGAARDEDEKGYDDGSHAYGTSPEV